MKKLLSIWRKNSARYRREQRISQAARGTVVMRGQLKKMTRFNQDVISGSVGR